MTSRRARSEGIGDRERFSRSFFLIFSIFLIFEVVRAIRLGLRRGVESLALRAKAHTFAQFAKGLFFRFARK